MLLKPSHEEYEALLRLAASGQSFDGSSFNIFTFKREEALTVV